MLKAENGGLTISGHAGTSASGTAQLPPGRQDNSGSGHFNQHSVQQLTLHPISPPQNGQAGTLPPMITTPSGQKKYVLEVSIGQQNRTGETSQPPSDPPNLPSQQDKLARPPQGTVLGRGSSYAESIPRSDDSDDTNSTYASASSQRSGRSFYEERARLLEAEAVKDLVGWRGAPRLPGWVASLTYTALSIHGRFTGTEVSQYDVHRPSTYAALKKKHLERLTQFGGEEYANKIIEAIEVTNQELKLNADAKVHFQQQEAQEQVNTANRGIQEELAAIVPYSPSLRSARQLGGLANWGETQLRENPEHPNRLWTPNRQEGVVYLNRR